MTRHDLFQTQPATGLGERWRDVTPLGNGVTGVSLYGGCRVETLIINRHNLWHQGNDGEIPDVSACLEKMRELMAAGQYEDACSMMFDALEEKQYSTRNACMRTLGQVKLTFDCPGVYSGYRRTLHMDSGESEITWKLDGIPYRRRTFVSRRRDLIVCRMESGNAGDVLAEMGFFPSGEGGLEDTARQLDAETARYRWEDDCLVYSARNDDGLWFGLVLKLESDGSVEKIPGDYPKLSVRAAKNTTLVAAPFSGAKNRDSGEKQALKRLLAAGVDYDRLFREHKRLHRRLYAAADVKLYQGRTFHSNEELLETARQTECGAELAEKLWRFGRYLFISGTGEQSNPFPLYGLWHAGYQRPWSQNVANENVEIIYWHAAAGGLQKLIPSLIHYFYRQMDTAREAARKLFGCRGIFISTYTTPRNCSPTPHVPVIIHFNGTAGWLSRHFYEYYLLTGDEDLLRREILPFMMEAAAFYEDFITWENGQVVICPSVSPENSPLQFMDTKRPTVTGHHMPVTRNATVEFAILKELLTNLIALAKDHEIPETRVKTWKKMLAGIPDYRINSDGAVAEWMDPEMMDNYFHRHLSHVYPLFPGTELEDTGRQDLIPAFQKAVELRQLGAMTGWSMAHMASIYARLDDGEKSLLMLTMLSKVCLLPNFFTLHNDYRCMGITVESMGDENFAPVQLDAIMGCVNAVQEMLLRVAPKRVYLLPACPGQWVRGSTRLSIFGGYIDLSWDLEKKSCRAVVCAQRQLDLTVVMPWSREERQICLQQGENTVLEM